MVESGALSYVGKCHDLLPERNEDVVLERDCGTHKVVVLCDGAGSCANGKTAAQLTAEALGEFLSVHFKRCLLEEQEILRREVVHLITEVLTESAQKAGEEIRSFGCTVLAAAMDHQGRWCLFHLGDGMVLGKIFPGSDWMIFSYPQRGISAGGTSLTMNGAMFENLRFYRHDYPSDRTLLLMSDGAQKVLGAVPKLLKKPELARELFAMEEPPEDDCSMAWLTTRQEF